MKLTAAPANFKTDKPMYKPYKSSKSGKKGMVYTKKGLIHFGDSSMKDFTQHKDEKRRASYCARSGGIKDKSGKRPGKDSANWWARKILWNC
tara:strand:+ start:15 stop:290 length:276 start_codon:yes stop_codon:yes gene_type:complete